MSLQAYDANEADVTEGTPLEGSCEQPQPKQAAFAAPDAAPASAQVRTSPPHLHAAKRPPAGPPSKPPPGPPRPAPIVIPPPNAWPTAPLPLPSQPKQPSQLKQPEQLQLSLRKAAVAEHLLSSEESNGSEAQQATAWACFQQNAAVSMQKAHSTETSAFQGAQPAGEPNSQRRSLDSLSPFACASEGPEWADPADPLPTSAALAIPARHAMEKEGSLKNISSISSLREWGAARGVSRRCSTERLPSLQDWMMPLCISSPTGSGQKPDPMLRSCSQDLLCSEAMPHAEHFVQWACNVAARPGLPSLPIRPSHELLERMPDALPEALPQRNDSASPKRSRGLGDYIDDDSPTAAAAQQQRPKSPRLTRSALSGAFTLGAGAKPSSGAPRCFRTGSPRAARPEASFADFHMSMDSLWGSGGESARHAPLLEPTTAR